MEKYRLFSKRQRFLRFHQK